MSGLGKVRVCELEERWRMTMSPLAPCGLQASSLRAQRRNPECSRGGILDCFAALAMTRVPQLRYQLARFHVVTSQPEMSVMRPLTAPPTMLRERSGRNTWA